MRNKRGFSLVELAIGIAVIAILILAIIASAGMRETARIHSAANTIQTMRSAAENYLASGNLDYTGISISALQAANLLPTSLGSNPFGGTYNVSPASSSDTTHFKIDLGSLNAVQASKLIAIFKNNANSTPTYDSSTSTWTVVF